LLFYRTNIQFMSFIQKIRQLFKSQDNEEEIIMKYLIVGLGNIGAKYENTRHNIGFKAVDALARKFEVQFKTDKLGDITQFRHKGRTFILLKPSTYMNLSGKSVRHWMQKHKIEKNNLLVIVDDLNLDFGSMRLRAKGNHGGHNGLKDIDQMTGGNNYARLRLGVGNSFAKGKQIDYVLGEWTSEEQDQLPALIEKAGEAALSYGTIGLSHTMNKFNKT